MGVVASNARGGSNRRSRRRSAKNRYKGSHSRRSRFKRSRFAMGRGMITSGIRCVSYRWSPRKGTNVNCTINGLLRAIRGRCGRRKCRRGSRMKARWERRFFKLPRSISVRVGCPRSRYRRCNRRYINGRTILRRSSRCVNFSPSRRAPCSEDRPM